jgi:hypothetical protein
MTVKKIEGEEVALEATFTKEQIVESKKYGDLAHAILKDDRSYTLKEVEDLIETYMKGEVK